MKKFEYIQAGAVTEAVQMMNSTVPEAMTTKSDADAFVVKAGGTDILDLIKEGILEPSRIIDLKAIPGLDTLTYENTSGLSFGPLVTIADLENNRDVYRNYRALHEACAHAATPQIRNMATMGGNLMQRPRCWYFRSNAHKCRKKGGRTCYAQIGQNQYHSIFNTNVCPCIHPSSIATALVAFDGSVELTGPEGVRTLTLDAFFIRPEENVLCENVASSKEIITKIMLPETGANTRSFYIKQGQRESYDWSMGDVAVVLKMQGKTCEDARIVLGAAAPLPWRVQNAENVLKGKQIDESLAAKAAETAMIGASPLKYNAYKIQLFKTIIQRAIVQAVA